MVSASFAATGGQDRANHALASYLARRGHGVHLVAHQVDDALLRAGRVTWHRARKPLGSTLLGEPHLRRLARQIAHRLGRPELRIIANGGNCDLPADVNWAHYVHAAYPRRPRGMLRRWRYAMAHRRFIQREERALHAARAIVANSHRTADDLVHRVGIPRGKIRVMYYGTDAETFHPPARPLQRAGPRAPCIVFIGGLGDDRKGFDTLLGAWSTLCADGSFDARLLVLGRGGELRMWKRRIARLNLSGRIEFLGLRRDVPELLRSCDLLVSPTRYEPYGLGVHEALCCGVPAIVSAGAGVAERYPDPLRHWLLPDPNDAIDLAKRIRAALAPSRAQRDAIARFSENLLARTWDEMARDIEELIERERHTPALRAELVPTT